MLCCGSLKMTVQYEWQHHATFSKYHPDNTEGKFDITLPDPVKGPEPMVALDDVDKANGAFGHTLCAEKPYGPTNNALMLTRQIAITQKVPPPTPGQDVVGGY